MLSIWFPVIQPSAHRTHLVERAGRCWWILCACIALGSGSRAHSVRSPTLGLIGPRNGTKIKWVFCFLGFQCIYWVSGVYNYSTIANSWFLIDCNIFWNIFGTTKNVAKSGPSDPVFITKILQKYKKDGSILEKSDFSYLRIWNSENIGRYVYLTC